MEPAQIDWKRIDSRFVEDVFYEHIRAPKYFDFLAPNHLDSIDDDAWFCKPECNHPKRPEDFFLTPTSSKHPSVRDTNETPGGSKEEKQRRRNQESENQNPNLATPPSYQAKSWRGALKPTSVKKMNKEIPRLKSTQSARNLFSGRDILGHISEFCYELKRLATRVTEREEDTGAKESHQQINEPYSANDLELKKERKPLLEVVVSKDKLHESTMDAKGSTFKEKRRRNKRVDDAENIPVPINAETLKKRGEERRRNKRVDDEENIPIPIPTPTPRVDDEENIPSPIPTPTPRVDDEENIPSPIPTPTPRVDDEENIPIPIPTPLKLENVKNRGLLQIRTNPPSPQCFSDNTLKPLRSKTTEKRKEEEEEKSGQGKEARGGLDVLWFLKPCTMAN